MHVPVNRPREPGSTCRRGLLAMASARSCKLPKGRGQVLSPPPFHNLTQHLVQSGRWHTSVCANHPARYQEKLITIVCPNVHGTYHWKRNSAQPSLLSQSSTHPPCQVTCFPALDPTSEDRARDSRHTASAAGDGCACTQAVLLLPGALPRARRIKPVPPAALRGSGCPCSNHVYLTLPALLKGKILVKSIWLP